MVSRIVLTCLALAAGAVTAAAADWRSQALTDVKAEPKVVDAIWSQDISLWVSVADDGSDRSGFAGYLCMLVSDAGRPDSSIVIVSILDAAALARNERKELGKAECS